MWQQLYSWTNVQIRWREESIKVIVCFGGGIDSTYLIHYYQQQGFDIQGIHFDYGQSACRGERRAAQAISKHYGVLINTAIIRPTIDVTSSGEFYGRNLLFMLSAINELKQFSGLISLGIHAHSIYYDCTLSFVQHAQMILDGYFNGRVVLDVPLLHGTKRDIWLQCKQDQVPVGLTFSCERGPVQPCGSCLSCQERSRHDFN